jgi:hypothetical protein
VEISLAKARQQLRDSYVDDLGPKPTWFRPHRRIAWECRAWIIQRAIGDGRVMIYDLALVRCLSCGAILTNKGLAAHGGRCGGCGAGEFTNRIGYKTGFWAVAKALVHGR